jgi:spore coat protein CotF
MKPVQILESLFYRPSIKMLIKGVVICLMLSQPFSCTNDASSDLENTDCYIEQFDQYGDFLYEHLKYNLWNSKPEDILPEAYRENFKKSFDSLYAIYGNQEVNEVLNQFETSNIISHEVRLTLDKMNEMFLIVPSTNDFTDHQSQLNQFANTKLNDPTISCADKNNIKMITTQFNSVFRYLNEVGFLKFKNQLQNNNLDRGCGDEILKCIGSIIVNAVASGLLIGSVTIPMLGAPIGGPVAIVGGIIYGFSYAISSGKCDCPGLGATCFPAMGLSLSFADCTPTATLNVSGLGTGVTSVGWAFVGADIATATTLPPFHRVTVTQTSPTVPVSATITTNCTVTGSSVTLTTPPFTMNLADLVKSVFGVGLFGPTITPSNSQGDAFTYYVAGVYGNILSRYDIVEWTVDNGVIISTSADKQTVEVVWDEEQTLGIIYVKVKNRCPEGETKILRVTVQIGKGPRQEGHE